MLTLFSMQSTLFCTIKHLDKGLIGSGEISCTSTPSLPPKKRCPFWPISNAALIFQNRPWLGLTFSSKLDWDSYIIPIAKTASTKIGAMELGSMMFLSPKVALYLYVWNTVVKFTLMLLAATWNSQISCKSRYVGLLILHLLPFLKTWLTVKMQPAYVFLS